MTASSGSDPDDLDDPVARLRRWESFGATWRVISRDESTLIISMCRCDGGEEVERISSGEPTLLEFVGTRQSSDD